jgi:hypothetical protein
MTSIFEESISRLGQLETVALSDRWIHFFRSWRLVRTLQTQGVSGTLLLCEPVDQKDATDTLLVKMAREPKPELLSEALVSDDLKSLVVPCCPNFMHVDYHCYMPWSYDLSDHGRPCLPRYTLFFRSARSRLAMKTLVSRFWYDTALVMSQMSLMLVALQLAQQLAEFTHYDAHLGNILIQRTPCKWMLYRVKVGWRAEPVCILLPTYGHYPFLIDYGRSHSVSISTQPSAIHYSLQHQECGIQSAVFDVGYDTHHILFNMTHAMQVDDSDEEEDEEEGDDEQTENIQDEQVKVDDPNDSEEHDSEEHTDSSSDSSAHSDTSSVSSSCSSDSEDEPDQPNYRSHTSEELLDLTIRMYKSLPINSGSGRRMYSCDICEELFHTLKKRMPQAELESFWLWDMWGPLIFDQLGALMKPLTAWGTHTPLPKRMLTEEGLQSVLEGIPVQKPFKIMMTFLCTLLPKGERSGSKSSGTSTTTIPTDQPVPLITRRSHWYGAVFNQWAQLCLETGTTPNVTATQLADNLKARLSAVGLDDCPPSCTVQWTASKLDWVAGAHHTRKFAELVQRMADVLLRVNVEEVEASWKDNTAGKVEPVDVVLQFTPTWIDSDDVPRPGDLVHVCDAMEKTSFQIELSESQVEESRRGVVAWLDWGDELSKRLLDPSSN